MDPYNVITEFYIVDVKSSHNEILRRPWLHMMKVVSFTYHQMVWYPTSTGTTDIRRDQAVARTIFAVAQKRSKWESKTPRAIPEKRKLKLVASQ